MTTEHTVVGAQEMRAWGQRLGGELSPGDVVVLTGPLGAGKTTLTQGIARGLGVSGRVTSPTFVIAHQHEGRTCRLVHVDAYRLSGPAEFDDLDLDLRGAVLVAEWGAGVVDHVCDAHLRVDIAADDDDVRILRCTGVGERWARGRWPC